MNEVHLHDYMTARKPVMPPIEGTDVGRRVDKNRMTSCRSKLKRFRRGEVIIEAGNILDVFARVQHGLVAATIILADGREFILEVIPPLGLIGDFDVLQGKASSLEYRAISDCEVFFFEGRWLRETCSSDPKIQDEVFARALARVAELESRIISNAGSFLLARVANTLLRLSAVYEKNMPDNADELIMSQHELASTVPASREKVNKCLRRLRELHMIGGTAGKIRIIDRAALQSIADGMGCLK